MRFIILFFLITACGKTQSPQEEEVTQFFSLETHGYYRAPFKPINPRLSRGINGRASIFINPVQFYAKVNLETPWKELPHIQMVHEGSECPGKRDDVNNDGFIDGIEILSSPAGKVLIPLDLDLSSQLSKWRDYPISNSKGGYLYSYATSSSRLLQDLRSPDPDVMDFLVKLAPYEQLNLKQRVALIYGVPESLSLPLSVRGLPGLSASMSLPVACGVFSETEDVFP